MPLSTQDFDPFMRHGQVNSGRIMRLLQKYLPPEISVERLEMEPGSGRYRFEGAGLPPATLFRFTSQQSAKEVVLPLALGPRSTLTGEEVPLVQIGTGYIPEIPLGEVRREGVTGVPAFEVLARRIQYGFDVGRYSGDPQAEVIQSYYQEAGNEQFRLPSGSLYINQFESMQQAARWAATTAAVSKEPDVFESDVSKLLAGSTSRMGRGWAFSAYMPGTGDEPSRIVGPGYFMPMATNIAADASIGTGVFYDKLQNLMKRVPVLGHRQVATALRRTEAGYERLPAQPVERVGEGPAWARMTGTLGTARDVDEGVYMRQAIPERGLARYPGASVLDAARFGDIGAFAFASRERVPLDIDLAQLIRPDRTAALRFMELAGKRFEAGQEVTIAEMFRGEKEGKEVWDPIKFTVGARPFVAGEQGAFVNIPYNAPRGVVEAMEKAGIPFTLRGDVSSAGLGSAIHLPGYQITDVSFKTGPKTFPSVLPEGVSMSAGGLPIDLITETKSPEFDYLQAVFSLPRKELLSFLHGFAGSKEFGAPGMQEWLQQMYSGRAQVNQAAIAQKYNQLSGAGDVRPFEAGLYQYFLKGIQNPVINQLWMQNYGMGLWEGELPIGMFSRGEMETHQAAARQAEELAGARPGAMAKRLRFEEQPGGDFLGYQRDRWMLYNRVQRPTPEMTGQALVGIPEMAAIEAAGYTRFAEETGLMLTMNPLAAGEVARDMPIAKRAWYHRLATWMGMEEKIPMPGSTVLEETDITRMRGILGEGGSPVEQVEALGAWYQERFGLHPERFRPMYLGQGVSLEDPRAILATEELDQLTQETRAFVTSRYLRHATSLLDPGVYGEEIGMRSIAYGYQRALTEQFTRKTGLVKELMGRRISTSIFGRYKGHPMLEANMVALSNERLLAMFGRTIGARSVTDPRFLGMKEFMAQEGGIPGVGFRYPTLRRGGEELPAVLPINIVTPEMAGITFPEGAGAFTEQDIAVGSLFSEFFYGDEDADTANILSMLRYNRSQREFYLTGDEKLRASVERYSDPEQARQLAEEVRQRVSTGMTPAELEEWGGGSALVKQFMDILGAGPGFPGKAAPIQLQDLQKAADAQAETMRARGLAYNAFLRGTEISMARMGWGKELIGRTLDAAMMQYQQPLDVKRGVSAFEHVYGSAKFNIWEGTSFPSSRDKLVLQWRTASEGRGKFPHPVWTEGSQLGEEQIIRAIADVAVGTEMMTPELLAGWFARGPEQYGDVLQAMQEARTPGEQLERIHGMIGKQVGFESPIVDQIINQAIIRGQRPHWRTGLTGAVRFAGKTFMGKTWEEMYAGTEGFRTLEKFWKKSGFAAPGEMLQAMGEVGESASFDALQSLMTSVGVHTPEQFDALRQAMATIADVRDDAARRYLEGGTLPERVRMSTLGWMATGEDRYGALTQARLGYLSQVGGMGEVFENLVLGPESWLAEAPSGAAAKGMEWENLLAASPEFRERHGLMLHAGTLEGVDKPQYLEYFPRTPRGAFAGGLEGTGPDFFAIEEGKLVMTDVKRLRKEEYQRLTQSALKRGASPTYQRYRLQQKLYARGIAELGRTGGAKALEDYFYQFAQREVGAERYTEEQARAMSREMAGIVMEQGEEGIVSRLMLREPGGTDYDVTTVQYDLSKVNLEQEAARAEQELFKEDWAFDAMRDVDRILGTEGGARGLQVRPTLPKAAVGAISSAVNYAYSRLSAAVGRGGRPADALLAEAEEQARLDRMAGRPPVIGEGGEGDDGGRKPPVTTAAPEEEPEGPRRFQDWQVVNRNISRMVRLQEQQVEFARQQLEKEYKVQFKGRPVDFMEALPIVRTAIEMAQDVTYPEEEANMMLGFYHKQLPQAIGAALGETQIGTTAEMMERWRAAPRDLPTWARLAQGIRAGGGLPVLKKAYAAHQAIKAASRPGVMESYLSVMHPGMMEEGFLRDEGAAIKMLRGMEPSGYSEYFTDLVGLQMGLQKQGLLTKSGMMQFPEIDEGAAKTISGLMKGIDGLTGKVVDLTKELSGLKDVEGKRRLEIEAEIGVAKAQRSRLLTEVGLVSQRALLQTDLTEKERYQAMDRLSRLQIRAADEQMGILAAQQERAEVDMPGATALSQFTRRLLGGWGLFYLRHMAGLGMGAMRVGVQETEAFRQQAALAEAGVLGTGAGLYTPSELYRQQALMRAGRGALGLLQDIGAGAPVGMARDVGGAALTGVGAWGALQFTAQHAERLGPLAPYVSFVGRFAPAIALGATALTLAGAQYQYAREREQTSIEAAAGMVGGRPWGYLEAGWKTMGPAAADIFDYLTGRKTPDEEHFFRETSEAVRMAREILAGQRTMDDLPPDERARMARVLALAEDPELAGVPVDTKLRLFMQGATKEQVAAIGTAAAAGVDVMGPAMALRKLTGADRHTPAALMPAATELALMDETRRARILGGIEMAGRMPGIEGLMGGRTDEQALHFVETVLGRIEGGPHEARFLRRAELRGRRRELGLPTLPLDSWKYVREREWTPEMVAAETQWAMMEQRGLDLTTGLVARGVELPAAQQMFGLMGTDAQALRFGEQLQQFNPIAIALQVAAGDTRSAIYNAMDIGMGGQVTGLPLWRTSLRTGASTNAFKDVEMTAAQIWGPNWQATDTSGIRGAMAWGIPGPTPGQTLYGTQASQWQMMQWQHEAAAASASNQLAQLRLGAAFQTGVGLGAYTGTVNPQTGQPFGFNTGQWSVNVPGQGAFTSTGGGFWGLQDAQRALNNMLQAYNFQQQRAQLEMSQRQFQENLAINRGQALMQRGWAREDWAYQEQVRGLQWGWRQEDFQEQLRFMTGRERRMAERQMGRETILHGLEGEQIDRQRQRQEEIWALEDQRYELAKKHNQEQAKFQEEAIRTQELFWQERRRLEEEGELLSRAYWVEQQALQEAAAGAQAALAERMRKAQEDMFALSLAEEERMGKIKVAQTLEVEMINTLIKGYNHILKHMGIEKLIPVFTADSGGGGGGTGGSGTRLGGKRASGGLLVPGTPWIVGEHEAEIFTPGQVGRLTPLSQAKSDPWNNTFIQPGHRARRAAEQPIHLTVQIGDETLGTYILDTVERKIKVL